MMIQREARPSCIYPTSSPVSPTHPCLLSLSRRESANNVMRAYRSDVVFYFISDLENFVNLSHQIRCATPKSRGNRVRRKSSAVQYLDVTFVRRSYYFWQILETADSTFQAQDPKVARVITFTSKNTQGEKTTSIYTIGACPMHYMCMHTCECR